MSSGPFFQVSCLRQTQLPLLPISASLPLATVEFLYQSKEICHHSEMSKPWRETMSAGNDVLIEIALMNTVERVMLAGESF